ncbi:MAG TPA: hypothetical protein OIM63_00240 [Bacilli bacterium]|jgi:hypothetical protein|nr:hypothetical protein [Bacilli bacterium]
MENILRIIYDKTINNKILSSKDIEKILELLVIQKCLNKYILNINVQQIRSNNLASYSNYTKEITIYTEMIEKMVKNIENNILIANNFEIILYKNLSILQVLLHEVEHANQQKIAYNDNTIEALIIRLSYLVNNTDYDILYEFCPEERLAEIKSFEEINNSICYINKDLTFLPNIIEMEELKRKLRGYHYKKGYITIPIVDYFNNSNNQELLAAFDLTNNVMDDYSLKERFKYGFPISIDEYGNSMNKLVLSLKKNFNNRINNIK